jgi:hypothetical protein
VCGRVHGRESVSNYWRCFRLVVFMDNNFEKLDEGIGRAVALAFAKRRAKVVIADVDVESAKECLKLLREKTDAEFIFTDVSKEESTEYTFFHFHLN